MSTENVAKVMAEAINADLHKVDEVKSAMLAGYDMIGAPGRAFTAVNPTKCCSNS